MRKVLLSLAVIFGISMAIAPAAKADNDSTVKSVISSINDFDGSSFGLNKQETEEVKNINSKLVESAFGIIDSDKSWFKKRGPLKELKKDAKKKYKKIFKGKGPVKKFKKEMKKKMRPFNRKMKLLKLIF
ncbi:MAG: hypothetical protein ACK5JS_00365 [Mangrovibacterium sp.]